MPDKALRLPVSVLQKDSSQDYCLFCLPSGGRDLLLSMAHRLEWDIYVTDDGDRVVLTDAERAIVDATIEGLIMSCDFSAIAAGLEAIAAALASNAGNQVSLTCAPDVNINCGGGGDFIVIPGPGQPPIVNPGPVPDEPIDPDNPIPYPPDWPTDPTAPGTGEPPGDYQDWETFDLAACEAANAMVEWAYQNCLAIADVVGDDLLILAVLVMTISNVIWSGIAVIFTTGYIIKLAETIIAFRKALLPAVAEEFFLGIAEWLDENRQSLVCDLYTSRANGTSGVNTFLARIFNYAAGGAAAAANWTAVQEALVMLFPPAMFFAMLGAGVGYENENAVSCDTCDGFITFTPDSFDINLALAVLSRVAVTIENAAIRVEKTQDSQNYFGSANLGSCVDFAALKSRYGVSNIVGACVELVDRRLMFGSDTLTGAPFVNAGTIDADAAALGYFQARYDNAYASPELTAYLLDRFGLSPTGVTSPSWNIGTTSLGEPPTNYFAYRVWFVGV